MAENETRYRLRSRSQPTGRPLWFQTMTGIGPRTTPDPDEAFIYSSREEAAQSPAMRHLLSSYEVEEVPRG